MLRNRKFLLSLVKTIGAVPNLLRKRSPFGCFVFIPCASPDPGDLSKYSISPALLSPRSCPQLLWPLHRSPFSSHPSWWGLGSRVPSSSRMLAEEQPCVLL